MATESRFAIAKVVLSRYFWPTSLILLKQSFLSPSWAIHSEPIRARGIIVYYYAVSGPPLYSVYRYWDILTEKIWKIFIRKWVLANQRSKRCFSHVKKKLKRPITIARDLFFSCEKNDTSNQKPQRYVSFAPKFLPLIGSCSLQRPRFASYFADIPRERQLSKVFLVQKWKTSRKLD